MERFEVTLKLRRVFVELRENLWFHNTSLLLLLFPNL